MAIVQLGSLVHTLSADPTSIVLGHMASPVFRRASHCLQTLLALFSVDDITGFQITNLVELPEPYGIIFLWGAVFPALFIFVASITNFVFKDNLILKVW